MHTRLLYTLMAVTTLATCKTTECARWPTCRNLYFLALFSCFTIFLLLGSSYHSRHCAICGKWEQKNWRTEDSVHPSLVCLSACQKVITSKLLNWLWLNLEILSFWNFTIVWHSNKIQRFANWMCVNHQDKEWEGTYSAGSSDWDHNFLRPSNWD
jgi:hypothetical protein